MSTWVSVKSCFNNNNNNNGIFRNYEYFQIKISGITWSNSASLIDWISLQSDITILHAKLNKLTVSYTDLCEAGWYSDNALDSYSEGVWFESHPSHQLPCQSHQENSGSIHLLSYGCFFSNTQTREELVHCVC
jgi:hypothetical protein